MTTSLTDGFKTLLKEGDTLYVPSKSTRLSSYEIFKKNLPKIEILPYDTKDEPPENSSVETVNIEIAGVSPEDKIKKLKNKIKGQNIFISNLEDVSYLLNLRSYGILNTSCIQAKALILKDETFVFTDQKIPKIKGVKVLPLNKLSSALSKTKEQILVNKNTITLSDFNLIKNPKNISKNPVATMASVKNSNEIKHYKSAFKRLDDALFAFQKQIKAGKSEYELKEIFEQELINHGAKCTSFKTILAIGENSSSIHYSSYDKKKIIKDGDVLLLDCGGYYEGGYATDITRVFVCGNGKNINPEVKKIYTAVLKAQLNVFFGDFNNTKALDDKARKILKPYEKAKNGGFLFPHSLGHGVGIPVHQAPPVVTSNPKYDSKLKNGMVFTIEPGLYKEGKFGIRLENTVYFYKNRKITLSKFPYEEKLIDEGMLTKKEQKWLAVWQMGKQND